MNYLIHIDKSFKARAGAVALRWSEPSAGRQAWTFGDLEALLGSYRWQLEQSGVQAGDICMVLIPASVPAMVGILAVMAEGAIPMVPPPGMGLGQWRTIQQRHKIKALLTGQPTPRKVGWIARLMQGKRIVLDASAKGSKTSVPVEVPDDQPGLISHSSGSTGQSKPIFRTHGVLRAQHEAIERVFPAWPGQVDFPLFPNVLLHNLATGTETVMPDLPGFQLGAMDAAVLWQQMVQHQVQTLTGNVYYFRRLVAYAQDQRSQPQVKAVGIGGSPVPENLLAAVQKLFPEATLYVIYGSSEAEPIAVRAYREPMCPKRGYAVGAIDPSLTWKVNNPTTIQIDGDAVEAGELWVRGPHVVAAGSDAWFKSGDIGYIHQGELYLTGRIGNESPIAGWQHYMLEHALVHVPGVDRIAALPQDAAFCLVYEGAAEVETIQEFMNTLEKAPPVSAIRRTEALPVDRRHHSKVLYRKIEL